MQLSDAIDLIQKINIATHTPQVWADLGCGDGLFTRAIATLLPEKSTVYAIDKLNNLSNKNIPGRSIIFHQADFEKEEWLLPKPDGILMANSLHYVRNQKIFIEKLLRKLNTGNPRLVFIEYDMDTSNPWVPYPLSFATLQKLIKSIGLPSLQKLGEKKSIYQRANIYASQVIIPN